MVKYESNKNEIISFMQVFGIILVVLGHSFTSENSLVLNRVIYSFHMPLFMFVSGYLFLNSKLKKTQQITSSISEFKSYLVKRSKRLLLPYWIISSIVFLPKVLLSRFSLRPVDFSINSYFEMLLFPGKNVIIFFWFLPTLFIISIISFFIWRGLLKDSTLVSWILLLFSALMISLFNPLSNFMFLNIEGVIHYLFYFLLGAFYCKYQIQLNLFLFNQLYIKLIVLITLHAFIIYLFLASVYYSQIIVITAILGIIESIMISHLYVQRKYSFINHLYGSSYSIYLFSWFPQVFIQFFVLKLLDIPWYSAAVVSTLSGVYIPYMIYRYLNYIKLRNKEGKYISMILGN